MPVSDFPPRRTNKETTSQPPSSRSHLCSSGELSEKHFPARLPNIAGSCLGPPFPWLCNEIAAFLFPRLLPFSLPFPPTDSSSPLRCFVVLEKQESPVAHCTCPAGPSPQGLSPSCRRIRNFPSLLLVISPLRFSFFLSHSFSTFLTKEVPLPG